MPIEKMPSELLAKWYRPVFGLCCLGIMLLKCWQFGNTAPTTYFDLISALMGGFLFESVSIVVFLLLHWNRMGAFLRFMVIYIAFVPHLTLTYLQKLFDAEYLFMLRDDIVNEKWAGAVAFWANDLMDLMMLLIPVLIMILGAHMMVMNPSRMQDSKTYSLKNLLKLPKWYLVVIILCLVMSLGIMFFAGMVNILRYTISLLAVCVIADSWERIRRGSSLEPPLVVAWAEVVLFVALALKGMVEIFG